MPLPGSLSNAKRGKNEKYLIHFIYLLVIGALAVMSRMKTNELENQLQLTEKRILETEARARMAEDEANRASEMANYAAARAREAEVRAQRVLNDKKR